LMLAGGRGSRPPGKEHRPAGNRAAGEQTGGGKSLDVKLSPAANVPVHRPWSRRGDGLELERRFRVDQAGWRRRIECARRLSYDAAD
jgi:hypothetical protein